MPVRAVQFNPKYCKEAKGTPVQSWDTSHDLSLLHEDGSRQIIGTFQTAHMAELVGVLLEKHYNNLEPKADV